MKPIQAIILQLVLASDKSKEVSERLFFCLCPAKIDRREILKNTGARSVFDLFRMNNISHA
jgi:hypothetical protein